MAVSYLTTRQLQAFNLWSTKRRKQLHAQEFYDNARRLSTSNETAWRDAAQLSLEKSKILSALTYAVNSDDFYQNKTLYLPPNVRAVLGNFARSQIS